MKQGIPYPFPEPPFSDRREAGRQLAGLLSGLALRSPIVLALPKGGAAVGLEIARRLGCPLEPLLVRKLCSGTPPHHQFGALCEGGVAVLDKAAALEHGLSPDDMGERLAHTARVLERRLMLYRPDHRLPSLSGRSVILADDFADSGWSALAALARVRKDRPHEVILALPVLPESTRLALREHVDALVYLHAPPCWQGPGAWYGEASAGGDEEALELISCASGPNPGRKP